MIESGLLLFSHENMPDFAYDLQKLREYLLQNGKSLDEVTELEIAKFRDQNWE